MIPSSLTISQKIRLSLCILLFGFFGSMIFGFIRGQSTEIEMQMVTQQDLPLAIKSKLVETAFQEQIRCYQDAVVMGETLLLEAARDKAQQQYSLLMEMQVLVNGFPELLHEVQDLQRSLKGFSLKAHQIYSQLEQAYDNELFVAEAQKLAMETEGYQHQLRRLTNRLNQRVDNQLEGVRFRSRQQRYLSLGLFLITALLSFCAVSVILKKGILQPLKDNLKAANLIAEGDFTYRLSTSSQDEIGALASAFNSMSGQLQQSLEGLHQEIQTRQGAERELARHRDQLEEMVQARTAELEKAQKELVASAHLAGKAEVATNVLHNVGNVLNSVNVVTGVLQDSVGNSKISKLQHVVGLVNQEKQDLARFLGAEGKGHALCTYLEELTHHLQDEQDRQNELLSDLAGHIGHITEIIAIQQAHGRVSTVTEFCSITELIEEAIQINASSITRHAIHIIRDYQEIPSFVMDRHKVLEILLNLISNAKDALKTGVVNPTLAIFTQKTSDLLVQIEIKDNGVGIDPVHQDKIFRHGFTTKSDGHGFGLHASANAAHAMQGQLSFYSAGCNQGTRFCLEIPFLEEASLVTEPC